MKSIRYFMTSALFTPAWAAPPHGHVLDHEPLEVASDLSADTAGADPPPQSTTPSQNPNRPSHHNRPSLREPPPPPPPPHSRHHQSRPRIRSTSRRCSLEGVKKERKLPAYHSAGGHCESEGSQHRAGPRRRRWRHASSQRRWRRRHASSYRRWRRRHLCYSAAAACSPRAAAAYLLLAAAACLLSAAAACSPRAAAAASAADLRRLALVARRTGGKARAQPRGLRRARQLARMPRS